MFAAACLLHAGAHGQALDQRMVSRHHFGFGTPVWLKARANFTAARATNPGAAPSAPATLADGRVDRFYDDGYNRVNSVGNPVLGGEPRTSFYGFQSGVQLLPTAGSGTVSLALHSVALNGGDYTRKFDNQPFPGLETFYRYDWKAGKSWTLSWEFAAAYHFFHWEKSGAANSTVDLITDTFALSGVDFSGIPTPFNGSATPVLGLPNIGSTPTRTQATVAAAVAGQRRLELHAGQLRLGPSFTWEPAVRWRLGWQTGLALGAGVSQLSFNEQITVADPATPVISQSGRSAEAQLWAGLYNSVRVSRHWNERCEIHVEARHLAVESMRHSGPTRSAEMNLAEGFALSAGVSYRF